jgi:hypothetical protein
MPSSQQVAGLPPLGGPGHLWALQGIVCLDLCLPDAYLPWAPQPPMIATSNLNMLFSQPGFSLQEFNHKCYVRFLVHQHTNHTMQP